MATGGKGDKARIALTLAGLATLSGDLAYWEEMEEMDWADDWPAARSSPDAAELWRDMEVE